VKPARGVRILHGCWPLAGHCSFCSRPIGTAVVLLVTPARLGAVCRRCDYGDDVAGRLVEIAARDGHLRPAALSGGGWA